MKMKKLFSIMLVLMIFSLIGAESVFAQDAEYDYEASADTETMSEETFFEDPVPERIPVDGSSLSAGDPFVFTITINSDENLSFADAQTRLSALLCPVGESADECLTMNMIPDSEDDVTMRVTFEMEELPFSGDYELDVRFSDETGTFANQSAFYLIQNVQEGENLEIPVTVNKVTLRPELLDEAGEPLLYNSVLYVGRPYTLRVSADSAMNNSVTVNAALPESIRNAPIDPDSECLQFLNEDRTALTIPGSRWTAESSNVFSCGIAFRDSAWVTAAPVTFSIESTGRRAAETFEMDPLSWSAYPVNISKQPATHQLQITDSRGNLLCSDTVPCGVFNEADSYILTYRFPAEWGSALPGGMDLSATLNWPGDWADALRQSLNRDLAAQFGTACAVDEEGRSSLTLTEISEGRYQVSCTFSPAGLTAPAVNPLTLHLNDNAWTVTDLKVILPSAIIPAETLPTVSPTEEITPELTETESAPLLTETPVATETADQPLIEPTETQTSESLIAVTPTETVAAELPAEESEMIETPTEAPEITEEPLPGIEITLDVKPVHLTPTMRDEAGNNLIYGSTIYVGEPYYLQIDADSSMNDSAAVMVKLGAGLLSAPLDPMSGCFDYLSGDGTTLSIPGGFWNEYDGNSFRCELRFTDSAWLPSDPIEFSVEPNVFPAADVTETYAMDSLSWNYYPVNVAKYAATHQIQITDSSGNLVCSDMVPCGVFNADDVYTFTYKFPADWGEAMPSGKSFSADLNWPWDWAAGLQNSEDWAVAAQFGEVCAVGPDGMTHFDLTENAQGRYSASCTFVPGGISSPSAASALLHLNDNAYHVSDLQVTLPQTIVKRQAALNPSLTLQMTADTEGAEQISNGGIGALYRTLNDFPNLTGGYGSPALYTLKAVINGVSAVRTPQFSDSVQVRWSVLDTLAQTGDLPSCLTPSGNGYQLGDLYQSEPGTWQAECSFRFPVTIPDNTSGDVLSMELVSGMYSTSASVAVTPQPFAKKALKVNVDVPSTPVLNQDMNIHAWLSDDTGGLSEYARTILSQTGAGLYSEWIFNSALSCQGTFDLTAAGEDNCTMRFDVPNGQDSNMHFVLNAPGLEQLFNVEFSPSADIHIARIDKTDAVLTPSLTLRMEPESVPAEQIAGGWISTLYRSIGEYPNSYYGIEAPAYYELRANVSGLYPNAQPQAGDSVRVYWNVLDELAYNGGLPDCITPADEGYALGTLTPSGETDWEASCGFYFPQTMRESLSAGPLRMRLVTSAYNGSAEALMNGPAFRHGNLYVTLDVPQNMLIKQPTEFRVKVSDDSGGLSEYSRAILNGAGSALINDWEYNYLTNCQGFFEVMDDGSATCEAWFDTPTGVESNMYFGFGSPAVETLFNVSWIPSREIHIQPVNAPVLELSVKLFHAGTEMPLPSSDEDVFIVGEDYQLQFYLTPQPEYRSIMNAVAVDGEGLVIDWFEPLRIRWGMLPGGETGVNFYRDGETFIGRYEFSFDTGGVQLEGNLREMILEAWIDGWEINNPYGMDGVRLPSRIERKPSSLSLSDFSSPLTGERVDVIRVDEETAFNVTFNGSFDKFDPLQLMVGYEANGIRTPIDCFPDSEDGTLRCTFIPQCTDYNLDNYSAVCGTDLSLYAVYNGDPYNEPSETVTKTFSVNRNEVKFFAVEEGSLSKLDMISVESVQANLEEMGYASMLIGGWNVDSFLPREIRKSSGAEYQVYPVIFRYELTGNAALDESLLSLEVRYQTGIGSAPIDDQILLSPRSVIDDKIYFELDFGSFEMLDDGRTVREALEDAVTILSLTVRYAGSPLVGAATGKFEAEDLTFALKVATLLDIDLDSSIPGTLRFGGSGGAEMQMQPFTVYCSQLYQPLLCSAEAPLPITNENGEPELSEIVDEGCWGKVQTKAGSAEIYINNGFYPLCYAAAWNDGKQIMIGMDLE